MKKNKLVFIFGPTGVGKTDLAVKIAYGIGEIISVDSMQVYQGLECGTAKPKTEHLKSIGHHLVSVIPPDYRFSAGDFKRLALKSIFDIYERGLLPILVGGTGLYFRALEYSMIDAPKACVKLREKLYKEEEENRGVLYKRLLQIDPKTADHLHPNDLVRIVRALEVYTLTGKRFSNYIQKENDNKFTILKIGVNIDRADLYKRLEVRCKRMVEYGLAREVYNLLIEGLTEKLPSMKGLGYSHFIQYYKGCYSYNETLRLFVRDTKRYAKRQLTWFRKENRTMWFHPNDYRSIRQRILAFKEM